MQQLAEQFLRSFLKPSRSSLGVFWDHQTRLQGKPDCLAPPGREQQEVVTFCNFQHLLTSSVTCPSPKGAWSTCPSWLQNGVRHPHHRCWGEACLSASLGCSSQRKQILWVRAWKGRDISRHVSDAPYRPTVPVTSEAFTQTKIPD